VFQEVEAPRFQDNRYMKVVRLSGLRTGRLYPPGNIPVEGRTDQRNAQINFSLINLLLFNLLRHVSAT